MAEEKFKVKKSPLHHFKRDISLDLVLFGFICVCISFVMVYYDVFDRWYVFSRQHEEWELDELFIVAIALLAAGSFMAIRHTFHLDRMLRQLRDTEESLKEERKIKAQNEKLASVGEIAGGMAHEINNALQPAIGMSDILKRRLQGQDPKLGEYVDMIYESSIQARNIVQNVLAFARGRYMDMHFQELHSLVENALAMALPIVPPGIDVKIDLETDTAPEKSPFVLANETGLSQVFSNLLKNASDAMNEKGRVWITLAFENHDEAKADSHNTAPGLYAKITIKDNGPGIPEETLKRIFDPFFTTKSVDKGTGLGLSTSFGLMRQFGGSIYAESVLGQGATFYLLLPILDESQKPEIDYEDDEGDLSLA